MWWQVNVHVHDFQLCSDNCMSFGIILQHMYTLYKHCRTKEYMYKHLQHGYNIVCINVMLLQHVFTIVHSLILRDNTCVHWHVNPQLSVTYTNACIQCYNIVVHVHVIVEHVAMITLGYFVNIRTMYIHW